MTGTKRISVQEFYELTKRVLEKRGYSHEAAVVATEELVEAQCRGITSNGAALLALVAAMRAGESPLGTIDVVRDTPSTALVHGNNNVGSLVAKVAMDLAIAKAERTGFGFVGATNDSPFLLGSYNPIRAARKGFIGLNWTTTSGYGDVVPYGSMEAAMATDPLAIALPTTDEPIVLDMTWAMAGGAPHWSIALYETLGQPLPDGWAINKAGFPTTDPQEAMDGLLLPMGGSKGSGLQIMLSLLTRGLFADAAETPGLAMSKIAEAFGDITNPEADPTAPVTSMVFVAARPDVFASQEEFKKTVSVIGARVRNSRPAPGFDEVRLPGDGGDRTRAKTIAEGILIKDGPIRDKGDDEAYIPTDVWEALLKLAE